MGGWHAQKWASDSFAGNSKQLEWVRQAYDAWKAETAAAAATTTDGDDDDDDDDDDTGKTYGRLTVEDQAVLKALTSGQSGDFLQIARKYAPTAAGFDELMTDAEAAGLSLAREGGGGKIRFGSGDTSFVIDVMQGYSTGGVAWHWQIPGGGPPGGPRGPGGPGGPGGGVPDPSTRFQGVFTPPDPSQFALPDVPRFTAPALPDQDPFAFQEFGGFQPFEAPTAETMLQEPGFQFRLGEGRKALERSAASKGMLRTGGTFKGLLDYGQNFASNEYQNVYNRERDQNRMLNQDRLTDYQTRYGTASGIYDKNAAQRLADYDRTFSGAQSEFAPQMQGYLTQSSAQQRAGEQAYANAWQRYMQQYNQFERDEEQDWTRGFDQQRLDLQAIGML
jgi:hypothetical protein